MMSSFIAADLDANIRSTQRIAISLRERLRWADHLSSILADNSRSSLSFRLAAIDALRAIDAPCSLLFDSPLPPPTRCPSSFLYIKPAVLGHSGQHPYLIRCPKCLRTAFTTLQGLLNHARIAHRLEWGTHEDCVRECAVLHPGLDTAAGVEVGIGPSGILPGIRSIFRMAVTDPSTTLGLHEDTPTLAPFLGKTPIRRGITVHGQDDPVNIVTLDSSPNRLSLPSRNDASRQVDHFNYSSDFVSAPPNVEIPLPPSLSQSRFYFTTRVIVTDRSLWIPPHRRQGQHSHRWMISLHSPSYAHDLTTILKGMTVTPAGTIYAGPNAVVGTSDRPFLAKIELLFNGTEPDSTQKILLEHWVELDSVKSASTTVGEEQIVDIELDKRTVIGPSNRTTAVDSKAIWDLAFPTADPIAAIAQEPNYSQLLRQLVSVKEPKNLQSMIMGRRKALEWTRARALRGAYLEEITGRKDYPLLSVGDVYVWSSSKGYSSRPETMQTFAEEDSSRSVNYCHICGFNQDICRLSCFEENATRNFPLADIKDILAPAAPIPIHAVVVPQSEFRALLSASDPKLVDFVKAPVELLSFPSFDGTHPGKLASYALLSLLVKSFIRSLILGGLSTSRQDLALKEGKKRRKCAFTRILTPSHIIRAVMTRGNEPLFRCIAQMGVP